MTRSPWNHAPEDDKNSSIVVYIIDRHPLEQFKDKEPFRWLHSEDGFFHELSEIIGPFDASKLSVLLDPNPSGPAWNQLIDLLVKGEIETVVTHLAPLSSGQRQQLIGVCAFTGASLITPGDGGRVSLRINPPS
jgi:hypothetical protein